MNVWLCPWTGHPMARLYRNLDISVCPKCNYKVDGWYPSSVDTYFVFNKDWDRIQVDGEWWHIRKGYETKLKDGNYAMNNILQRLDDTVYLYVGQEWPQQPSNLQVLK